MRKTKILFLLLSVFMITFLQAEVSFITLNDEKSYDSVKDFSNTYEINFNKHGSSEVAKCQAVRLAKNWFITAAHCVKSPCDDGTCSFQARLIVGPNYEADLTTTHGKKFSKKIFNFSKTKLDNKDLLYDIALIYFDPKETKTVFKDPLHMHYISEAEFLRRIPSKATYLRALNGTHLPTILVINNKQPIVLKRNLSIVSIWSGKRDLLKNSDAPVFYSPKLANIITRNFGVIKGISGSGVMTNTGELLGIVSAKAELKSSRFSNPIPLVYIAPFDKEIMNFILKHIPNISYIEADKKFYRTLTEKEEKDLGIIENIKFNLQ